MRGQHVYWQGKSNQGHSSFSNHLSSGFFHSMNESVPLAVLENNVINYLLEKCDEEIGLIIFKNKLLIRPKWFL